jgi:DNA-binding response OmpR family regulator
MAETPRTVLIIEHDWATCLMYTRALQETYHVIAASDEADIDQLLAGHALHAVVLEPGPVGGRGWDLLAELKRRPQTRATPVILCTVQDEKRRGLEMGAAAYLVKPVLPADLLSAIRRIVDGDNPAGGSANS